MNFDYDIENEDGEVLANVQVGAQFSPYVPAFTSGRPEDCYPAEGGELEDLVVYLGDVDVTDNLTEKTYFKIRDYARERLR